MKIKKTPVYSSSSSSSSSTRRRVDRVGFGRNRRRRLELRLRLRFRRLLREKKSNDVSPESKIRIEDEWIDWMILWTNAATETAAITDPTTTTIQDSELKVGAVLLNQAFRKRTELVEKESYLSPIDAAMIIQKHFRAHLIRKSKAIQALRELAIANTKLKEIRNLYNNGLSFLRRLSQDAEERQRFQENIIVLLLTVDAIDGATVKLRLGQKIIIDELETMLDKTEKFTALNNDYNVDMDEQGGVLLRRAFGKEKKKRKEMSLEEAAIKIQVRFREYLVRKAQASRANEELALAKEKLKEIRDLFNNSFSNRIRLDEGGNDEERMRFSEKIIVMLLTCCFSNRVHLDEGGNDEERMRLSEKIIVLLLTVDGIEGANVETRGFKRAMVNELEEMLEIVDPQPDSSN